MGDGAVKRGVVLPARPQQPVVDHRHASFFLSFHPFLSGQGRQGRRTGWQRCLVKHVAWTTLTDGLGWAHAYWSFPAFTKSPPAGIFSDPHVGCTAGKLLDDYREDIAGAFRRERHCSDWEWNCDLNLVHHCEWSCMTVDAWAPLACDVPRNGHETTPHIGAPALLHTDLRP
jgi:hypothetical protein